uniref:Retrotransposon protein, putative, Ty1-copia subclass n=1 Tax=Tanacetum cinerariifolium TaxID=118510 RepID=A0A699IDF8_TANCI|nr:hypothetical protein [Tanacetum cinerariifolium]
MINSPSLAYTTLQRLDLGEAENILGIKIYRDRSKRLIRLCQIAYIEEILKRSKMENSKCKSYLMQEKLILSKTQGPSTPEENILKYLRNTKDMFLDYGGDLNGEIRATCYTDIGYETDANDIKSQAGYILVQKGGVVDWKSAKQSTIAMSSTEAKYIAALKVSMEAIWIRKFIDGLGVVPTNKEPMEM